MKVYNFFSYLRLYTAFLQFVNTANELIFMYRIPPVARFTAYYNSSVRFQTIQSSLAEEKLSETLKYNNSSLKNMIVLISYQGVCTFI